MKIKNILLVLVILCGLISNFHVAASSNPRGEPDGQEDRGEPDGQEDRGDPDGSSK